MSLPHGEFDRLLDNARWVRALGVELVAEDELSRQLILALTELEEPFRSTLLQRFYRGETPEEIARRQGVPTAGCGGVGADGGAVREGQRRLPSSEDELRPQAELLQS